MFQDILEEQQSPQGVVHKWLNQLLGLRYFWLLEKVVLTKSRVKQIKWNQLIEK